MGDQQDTRNVTGQTGDGFKEKFQRFLDMLLPGTTYVVGKVIDLLSHVNRGIRNLAVPEEDLMAIPRPEENKQRTFVAYVSDETADKLRAMFKRNFCPDIVPLTNSLELPPECQLVICCLPKNTRQMYLNDETVFVKLISDAGPLQAMVLIIIFGEKETPEETLHDEKIYGHVLRQGHDLYKKGRMHSQESPLKEQTSGGVSKSVALVTVDNRPSKYQLFFMKKFVEDAFTDKKTIPKSS